MVNTGQPNTGFNVNRNRKVGNVNRMDVGELIPPNFNENSNKAISNQMFKQNITTNNPFKDPKWHPLITHVPDVLADTIIMTKINKNQLFLPDEDDVIHIENEVNYYRNQRDREEMEMTQMLRNKEELINDIRKEQEYEDKEEYLKELEHQDMQYKSKLEQLRRKRQMLENQNLELSQQRISSRQNQHNSMEQMDLHDSYRGRSNIQQNQNIFVEPPQYHDNSPQKPQPIYEEQPVSRTRQAQFEPTFNQYQYQHHSQQQEELEWAPPKIESTYNNRGGFNRNTSNAFANNSISQSRAPTMYNVGGRQYTAETLPSQYRYLLN